MKRSNSVPEVNAGSMADIAFLLLMFFLVSSAIPNDKGFNRKLAAKCPPNVKCSDEIADRNMMRIYINDQNHIMVNENVIDISELKDNTKDFVDNNGDGSCSYCKGKGLPNASNNPKEAVLSLQASKQSSYTTFIEVQDEITKAFFELRQTYSNNILNKTIENLSEEEQMELKKAYPFTLSEAQTK
ncbi:biopolymer transporter ExbD [Flavobacteriaceae bacterium XHP0103]|uniref:ExbD/TolR family protein n=1 Tax=Marixanthotalea marina TaxID=2844359 RepID=UPI002989EABA|nr:biopolymer transporter ExbD [Marixanthotalea marina]MBU3822202.1 biopolymer transporter ExbD [Marixanthotalea marina]